MCRGSRLEKASKEFNGLAQRTEQQATAFEHKVPGILACHTSWTVRLLTFKIHISKTHFP